jgi:hypothetical protein
MSADYYANSLEHILAQLERIDLLIQAQVSRARQLHKADEQFQGLVISEQEVDELLARPVGIPRFMTAPEPPGLADLQSALDQIRERTRLREEASAQKGIRLRLVELERLFTLTPLDIDCMLICLAPELDLRYERLYSYLQDDVTKKRPTVDLVLNLLCPSFEAKLSERQRFAPSAPLVDRGLLHLFEDPSQHQTTLLAKYLRVDERVVDYLLGSDRPTPPLSSFIRGVKPKTALEDLALPAEMRSRLSLLGQRRKSEGLILYFQGPYGVGRQATAQAVSGELGLGLLVIDGEALMNAPGLTFDDAVRLAEREAVLQGAALYWEGFDALLADDKRLLRSALFSRLEQGRRITFLAGTTAWEPTDELANFPFVRVEFARPSYDERLRHWRTALNDGATAETDAGALANKFRFSGGQITDAARTARNLACWRDPENGQVTMAELHEACRLHSSRKLSTLGRKIKPHHTWNDIVLPEDRLQQLREICNSMKYRSVVYDQWGFDRKLSLGKGLNILFAGPSGTGKTMAAGIMAGELGLDLYKIDLSTVVSKYIGETEKNLARIFAEAESSNAILFFDEADALFGKRSEVRDSHDRYANIEINYLLQKMEEHEGVAILATNFRKNMDDAFVRRMHFTVEFPFPNEADRRRIWERTWPAEMPQSAEIDLDFMARRFEIAGGNIRNIALAAAFLAASDGGVVNMTHLLHGTRREFQKMGKVVMQGEFGAQPEE